MYGDFQSDGYVTFNNYVQLTLDGAKFVTGESGGGITLGNYNHLTLRNGAGLSTLGDFNAQGTATMITLESNSLLASYTQMYFGGAGSRFVLDDSEVMVHHAEHRLWMNNTNSDDLRWIIKGRNPRINMARINTAKKPLPVDLVVPVGGFTSAPFRKVFQSKQTNELPCDSGSYEPFVFTVDPSSPALADNRTVTMPIFDCMDSLTASEFTLNTDTGISWAWSDPYAKGKNTWLSLTVAGQGASAATPAEVQEPVVRKYGPYTIYSYTDTSKVGVFTAAADTTADVLLVAGGGSGGWSYPEDKEYSSAGGGAGGLHEYKNIAITAGSYIVNVGRGGNNRPWDRFQRSIGMNGFDTSVFGYHVYGGGGGASLSRDWNASRGQPGGSGGGCCNGSTTVGIALVAGEGYAGGSGVGDNYGAGGGGAGGVGKNGKSTSSHGIATMNGDGGPGVSSDISGETREYAGGGGAAATSRRAIGGSGTHGGGCGGDRYCNARGGDGVDGTGSGGGGGAWSRLEWQENPFVTWGQICGGKGGDGIVIIRARTESSTDVPYVAFRKLTAAKDGASVEWEYLEAGGSAAETGTSFKFVFTDTESGIAYTNSVAAGESYGVKTTVIGGLKSGTTYNAKILATNASDAESPSDRATFTLVTLNEKGDGVSLAGLIEGSAVGTVNDQSFDIRSAADAARQLGVVMADRRGDYVSPFDGHVSYWQKKKTYGYSGYMFMKAGVPYSFVGCFVYVNSIKVNGNMILNRDEEAPYTVSDAFTPIADGWYPIEIRIGTHDSDWWGPYNSFSYGVAWSTNAVRSSTAEWEHITTKGWDQFLDPGDGSLLRTAIPKARELSLAGAMWNGARTVLTATVNSETDGETPLEVIACYGENYGDEDPSAWTTEAVAVLSAEETSATATFDNLPAKGYLRFMAYLLDANSNRTDEVVWSESIFLTEFDEHELEVPSVTLGDIESGATGLIIPVTILSTGSETDRCDIVIEYGTTDQLGSTNIVVGLPVGAQRLELTGLMPLGGYYVRVYATNSAGDSEKSAVKSASTTALVEENGAGIGGFYQAKFEVGPSDATWITKTLADSVIPVEIVPYAGMADCYATKDNYNTVGYTNPNTGTTVHWNFSNSTFLYSGYLYLKAGEKITFGKRLDDAVYVKVGDTVVINNTNWQTFSTGSFTAPADGYYPIEVRVADGSDGKGPSASEWDLDMGVAYNFINRTTLTPKSDWHRLNNDDGERFYATIGTRAVTVASYSIANDELTANLTFGEMFAEESKPLYVAYGPAYGGIDTNAWAHVEKVGDFDETSSGTTYVGLSGLGTDVKYVRFFFDNGTVTTWSSSILLGDLTTPKLDHNSATVANLWKGDAFDVSCALVYDAGGAVTVQAEVSRTGTFDDVQIWPMILNNETGLYGVTIYTNDTESVRYVVPGTPIYVRFRATGANEKSDVTEAVAVTPAASSAWANAAPTLSASHNRITAKASLTTFGAHLNELDGTYVRAYAGTDPKNLALMGDPVMVTAAGEASVSFDVSSVGVVWYVQLEYSNSCSTAVWTGRTTSGSITPVDAAIYTWTGLGGDGIWSNPDNWSCSSAVSGGYPKTQSATAIFPDNASGTVKIDSSYIIGNFKLTGNGADITFTSLNLDLKNGYVQANFYGGSRNSKWTIDACSLKFTNDNIGWGSDSKRTASNNVVRVTNAGKFTSSYKVYFVGDDNTLIVEKGSTFEVTTTGHALYVGGDRTKVVIDDSYIFAGDRFYFNQGYNATGEQLVLKGAHPIVKARSKLQIIKTGDVAVVYVVPYGGFAESPIQPYDRTSSSLGSLFSEGDANSKFIMQVASDSPALRRKHVTETTLIDWINTKGKYIDTSKRCDVIEVDDAGVKVDMIWTYGSDASETPSGNPTGLKVRANGVRGFVINLL